LATLPAPQKKKKNFLSSHNDDPHMMQYYHGTSTPLFTPLLFHPKRIHPAITPQDLLEHFGEIEVTSGISASDFMNIASLLDD
jgi:hypothetical protein